MRNSESKDPIDWLSKLQHWISLSRSIGDDKCFHCNFNCYLSSQSVVHKIATLTRLCTVLFPLLKFLLNNMLGIVFFFFISWIFYICQLVCLSLLCVEIGSWIKEGLCKKFSFHLEIKTLSTVIVNNYLDNVIICVWSTLFFYITHRSLDNWYSGISHCICRRVYDVKWCI